MQISAALLLAIGATLVGVSDGHGHGHEHEHAHRHRQFVGRHEHGHHHHKRQLELSFGFNGISFGIATGSSTPSIKSSTTTTTTRTSSKSSSTVNTTTKSSTTTTTTKSSSTSTKTSTKSSSSSTTTTTKAAQTSTSTQSSAKSSSASVTISSKASSSSVSASSTVRVLTASTNNATNLTTSTNSTSSAGSLTVGSTILVIARDQDSIDQAVPGLNGYGIPFQTLIVPSTGASLPTLNTSTGGNFGGFVIASGLVYYYSNTSSWHSALTDDQWNQLYAYQLQFKVRMVQYDVWPSSDFGVSALGGCCNSGVEQNVSFTNTTAFAQAGLKQGASMSTMGIWHNLAQITDAGTTTEIAQFAPNSQYSSPATAAVINNFSGREQMVFFLSWATSWSPTSTYLQHAYITWMTRGLYAGYRRVNLQTQIDDVMLRTQIYYPGNSTTYYRLNTSDMDTIKAWTPQINAKMNIGSYYRVELGHNGNGNVIYAEPNDSQDACGVGPIYTVYSATDLEYQKPLGSGTDGWPTWAPANYSYTKACLSQDPLWTWMSTPSNRDWFYHISHTFTHEGENNATYNDIYKEINWNQQWFSQSGIGAGNFTADGLIPPQITGLHNGDALRAWSDNGLTNCVGDNSRSVLVNQQNAMWPYTTTMAANGFDGITVVPRWAGRTYYNCDTPACTTQEWTDTSGGNGDFGTLMADEIHDATRYLLGLHHDGFMFHQLNMRNQGTSPITTPDGTQVNSLLQNWVENVVQEFVRLVNWPMISLKQTDLAKSFRDRQARDACGYQLSWSIVGGAITAVTVSSSSNSCSATIPVTVPGTVMDTQTFATEKIGNDPLTIWVKLSGQPVTLNLAAPIVL